MNENNFIQGSKKPALRLQRGLFIVYQMGIALFFSSRTELSSWSWAA